MSWLRSHEQEQIEFLQQMIRIPSVTGNEGPIQEFMAKTLTEMGLAVDSFVPSLEELQKHPAYVAPAQPYEGRPDVVGTLKGAGGGRSLLFNGHIDVIPEGSLDNWQHDPWSADIADGKMYGRGTSDMKSGAAAMTMAIRAIQACGIRLKGDLIVEYVMDEELTGNGTLACVMKGYKADAGICCETSSMCPARLDRPDLVHHQRQGQGRRHPEAPRGRQRHRPRLSRLQGCGGVRGAAHE